MDNLNEIFNLIYENKAAFGLVILVIAKIINRFNKDVVSDGLLGKLNYYNSKIATFGGKPTEIIKK